MKLFQVIFFIAFLLWMFSCNSDQHTLFKKIPSSHSGITFKNQITENDSINPLKVVNIYTMVAVSALAILIMMQLAGYFFHRQYGALQIISRGTKAILSLKTSLKKQVLKEWADGANFPRRFNSRY